MQGRDVRIMKEESGELGFGEENGDELTIRLAVDRFASKWKRRDLTMRKKTKVLR